MHMADALLSPAVGGTMWAVSAAAIAFSSRKIRSGQDDRTVPLMGVLGAFIFAAQMVNFTIPGTGSSGHLGGALILSILLGPYAAFLTTASVLVVQAFFFADGGLLALGCNIFNIGFFPAFVTYPFIYKKIIGRSPSAVRISVASLSAAVVGLQLGALGVVTETFFSDISSLPFYPFIAIMQPIHLAIGIVEGLVTASVISFIYNAKPEVLHRTTSGQPTDGNRIRTVALYFLAAALVTGGVVSWFASEHPDGLEWSIQSVTGLPGLKTPDQEIHKKFTRLQEKFSLLPDYAFKRPDTLKAAEAPASAAPGRVKEPGRDRFGTTVSGIVGGMMTLALTLLAGVALKRRRQQEGTVAESDR